MEKKQEPGEHRYREDQTLTMTAGFGLHTDDSDPIKLLDLGLDDASLKSMTEDNVEGYIREIFEDFVWATVGDSCGWKVEG